MGKTARKAKAKAPTTAAGVGLNGGQLKRLGVADRLAEGTRLDRQRAAHLVRGVQAELAEQADTLSLRAHLQTTAELEAARTGEAAPVVIAQSGPVRVRSRDGLLTLRDTGTVTPVQAEAGLAYRAFYERAGQGLRSQLGERTGGAGSADLANLARAYMLARLNQVERAVMNAAPHGCELATLRLVAGEGWSIASLGKSGAARKRHTAALVAALNVAALTLGLANRGQLSSHP